MNNPTPEQVRLARSQAGLSAQQAGELVHKNYRAWQRWEAGDAVMNSALWELFCIKTGTSVRVPRCRKATHPGEVLALEFMEPASLTAEELATALGIETNRLRRIMDEEARVDAEIAGRLSDYFKTSLDYWLSLQRRCDEQQLQNNK